MFATIIVGIDGSDGGRDALALARTLADDDSQLVLVTSFPYDQHLTRGAFRRYEDLRCEETTKALHDVAAGIPRCRVHAIADASPGRALHEEAEREQADLIVVGSCHRGTIGRVLLGDVSRATLRGAPCPVAVAPRGYSDQVSMPLQSIGVGFNGTDQSEAALAFSVRLAGAVGGQLHIWTAVTTPTAMGAGYVYAYDGVQAESRLSAERQLTKAAETLDVPTETKTVDESPGIALEQLSEHVDLVVAGSRGWGATHRVVLGSTTDHITHHAHCPVIVVGVPVADRERPSHAVLEVLF